MRTLLPASKSQTVSFSTEFWGGKNLIFHNWGIAEVYSERASLCCFSNLEKIPSPLVQSYLIIWYIVVFPHTVWTAHRHPVQVFSGEEGCSENWRAIDDRCERRSGDVYLLDRAFVLPHLTGIKYYHTRRKIFMSVLIVNKYSKAMFWSVNLIWLIGFNPRMAEGIRDDSKARL